MLIKNMNTGNKVKYPTKNTNSQDQMKKLIKPLAKMVAYCAMILKILSLKMTLNNAQLTQLLTQLVKYTTFINSNVVNMLLQDGTVLSSALKTVISTSIPMLTLTYIEHIYLHHRVAIKAGNVPQLFARYKQISGKLEGTISSISLLGVGGPTFKMMNQVILPQFGKGRQIDELQKQVVSIMESSMAFLTIAIAYQGKELLSAAKADQAVDKMTKIVNDYLRRMPHSIKDILKINSV